MSELPNQAAFQAASPSCKISAETPPRQNPIEPQEGSPFSLLADISDNGSVADWSQSSNLDDISIMSGSTTPPTPGTSGTGNTNPTPPTSWKPMKPIMGNICRVGKDEEAARTGGLPKSDWSNLDATALNEPVTPNQYRSSSIATSQKVHNYRRTGLKDKFARSGDLVTFQHHVWSHLVDTGMDSIAYVPDPVDPNIMVNIVKDHGRFTLESVSRLIKPQLLKYDSYDKANDAEASEFLVDSLEADLAKELREIKEPDDPFPKVWIRFIRTIRSISIDRFEDLKKKIKACKPTQYPGQDLSKMALDLRSYAKELEVAGQYDHNLTLHMLNSFLDAGGQGNEDFRFPLRTIKANLNTALIEIGYLSYQDAHQKMVNDKLTYKDVYTIQDIAG